MPFNDRIRSYQWSSFAHENSSFHRGRTAAMPKLFRISHHDAGLRERQRAPIHSIRCASRMPRVHILRTLAFRPDNRMPMNIHLNKFRKHFRLAVISPATVCTSYLSSADAKPTTEMTGELKIAERRKKKKTLRSAL